MNLFIDTNIYLTFYHYSSDDLEELKKLSSAINNRAITLYCTDQVKDEFRRNRHKYPSIKLADDMEKELAIANLVSSSNFASTHAAIARLARFGDFTIAQIREIIEAAVSNRQVYWISGDSDVSEFMRNLIRGREAEIDPDKLAHFHSLYVPEPEAAPVEGEDISF